MHLLFLQSGALNVGKDPSSLTQPEILRWLQDGVGCSGDNSLGPLILQTGGAAARYGRAVSAHLPEKTSMHPGCISVCGWDAAKVCTYEGIHWEFCICQSYNTGFLLSLIHLWIGTKQSKTVRFSKQYVLKAGLNVIAGDHGLTHLLGKIVL